MYQLLTESPNDRHDVLPPYKFLTHDVKNSISAVCHPDPGGHLHKLMARGVGD